MSSRRCEVCALRENVDAAVNWLLERQHADGWWSGELETNVTMTAELVLLLRFLGITLDPIRAGAREHILQEQREDGSWALYYEGPADLSTTIEAYAALKVLGLDATSAPMRRALGIIHRLGGLAQARVFTKIWLALFGEHPWSGIPTMPPELIYMPPQVPLNLYDFACWARGTIAPLTIVISRRPVRKLGVDLGELVVPGTECSLSHVQGAGIFWWLDKLLKLYELMPAKPGRRRAQAQVARWIVEHQEADGSWGGIQPPWVYSLIALNLQGMDINHPVMRKGLDGMQRFSLEDERGWRFQACMSPVWDTAWVVRALRVAGFGPDHPAMHRAVGWLLDEQIAGGGDWQVRCKGVECGGWAFEFDNDIYPDIDDTAVVVLALLEGGDRQRVCAAVERAVRWVLAMRSSNRAWAAFDRDNTRQLAYSIPFADFGAMIDPPSEDVTAHVLEMLGALGYDQREPNVAGGLSYLRQTQTPAGSWYGRWGVNHVYGTWCVLDSLEALHLDGDMSRRGAQWLLSVQNADGGWGETCHSYADASFAGVGKSTPSQTAWAVLGLQSAGLGTSAGCVRGLNFLRQRQEGGTWPEPDHTGTGFPRDFYINYHLYRHVFPTMALAADEARAAASQPVGNKSLLVERVSR
ncbi:MAG: squalene--hopene cyclase [Candidatus Eremiobacteraeota bacterium]|nr:squalene--hopene cyclase [Candidatus Eremiobacteraeota bacterium]